MEIEEKLGFKEITLNTAEEFIELIRPDKKNIKPHIESLNSDWIYRGHADSEWELLPSLFRHISIDEILSNSYEGVCFSHWVHLKTFVQGCDFNSSVVPFDSFEFRSEWLESFDDRVVRDSRMWPDPKLYELIAYAQHYGVWTEFLDWTKNPLIACYFMASQVVKMKKTKGLMSLWIFDTEKKSLLNDSDVKNVEIIEVPKSVNQNISSQQGCFTLVRQKLMRGTRITFDESSQRYKEIQLLNELAAEKRVNSILKISVPCETAIEILDYCNAYSINAATVFRGISGAATYVQERLEMRYYRKLLVSK